MTIAEIVQNQLYFLVTELDSQVGHLDNTGSIIGYSVVNGLLHYAGGPKSIKSHTAFRYQGLSQLDIEAIKRGEVKAVCNSLRRSIDLISQTSTNEVLSSLSQETNTYISPLLEESVAYSGNSMLLEKVISSMRGQKDYDDVLRRKGLLLFDNLKSRKGQKRPEDIAKEDYISLRKTFVDIKLVNYQPN